MALRVRVCRLEDVDGRDGRDGWRDGSMRGFAVEGVTWPVMVARVDGELVAFPGVCPHDDVSLVDYGIVEGHHLRCRVHGYRFDLRDGECEHAPYLNLRRYKITISDGELWVDLL